MRRKGGAKAPDLRVELAAGFPCRKLIAVDEVGRGCLAGPVVVGAIVLPSDPLLTSDIHRDWLAEVRDSKLLSAEDRERLAPLVRGWASAWAIGEASVEEIDRLNIYHATHLAMERAVACIERLGFIADLVLIDGNAAPRSLKSRAQTEVKGDMRCLSIAMASVLAKVHRDQLMREAEVRFPGYGYAQHKGYSTPEHQRALQERGVTPLHRRSFAPVREALPPAERVGALHAEDIRNEEFAFGSPSSAVARSRAASRTP